MARKEKTIHYIYKTTCNATGKYYVGMHSTINENDGYLGSGKRLRYSIRKYGAENHTREILEYCNTRETLVLREIEIVTKELIAEPMCMNLCIGGQGGFISLEGAKKGGEKSNEIFQNRILTDPTFKEFIRAKRSDICKRDYTKRVKNGFGLDNFKGKSHSEESKQLMSETKKGQGTGESNSQYGTCWVTKDGINKKIKKEELDKIVLEGWVKGRK